MWTKANDLRLGIVMALRKGLSMRRLLTEEISARPPMPLLSIFSQPFESSSAALQWGDTGLI
jgi:hypothetical protein